MFANRVEGRHSCDFVHILGAVDKLRFYLFLGLISLLEATPGASRAALDDQVGSQVDLLMVLGVPRVSCGPFGRPWACLGATLGVTLAAEVGRGDSKRKLPGHIAFPSPF